MIDKYVCLNIHKQIKIVNGEKVFDNNLCLSNYDLTSLETLDISDVIVNGYFYCDHNNLTSLKGAPKQVNGSFYCYRNNFKSLKGLPENIRGCIYIEKRVVRKLYLTNDVVSLYLMQDKFCLL